MSSGVPHVGGQYVSGQHEAAVRGTCANPTERVAAERNSAAVWMRAYAAATGEPEDSMKVHNSAPNHIGGVSRNWLKAFVLVPPYPAAIVTQTYYTSINQMTRQGFVKDTQQ